MYLMDKHFAIFYLEIKNVNISNFLGLFNYFQMFIQRWYFFNLELQIDK